MSVARLLVEGKDLDAVIFAAICAGNPVVTGDCPKGSLAPRARDLRKETGTAVCYIRDRDFDYLAPMDLTQPTVDATLQGGSVLGWRWCRHEIENYLIDPGVVHAAFGWDRTAYEAQLVAAARSINHYQAARWTAGQSRQVLPPARDFPNKPAECVGHEFRLPADLSQAGTAAWVQTQASTFIGTVQTALASAAINTALGEHSARLSDAFLGDVNNVLLWCCGKDLLTSLQPWLQATHRLDPSKLRTEVRNWIGRNPDQTLVLLPEWDAFRNLLRTYT